MAEESQGREEFVFPGAVGDRSGDEEADVKLVTLCSVAADEADAICDKLDAVHIPSEIADDPGDPARKRVEVLEEHLDAAREALVAPPDEPDEGEDEEDAAEHERYLASHWMCPKCRQRKLELLPLTGNWRRLRNALIVVCCLPVFGIAAGRLFDELFEGFLPWVMSTWIVLFVVLIYVWTYAPRVTRCTECGWVGRRD